MPATLLSTCSDVLLATWGIGLLFGVALGAAVTYFIVYDRREGL